jgi:hypothetical protein
MRHTKKSDTIEATQWFSNGDHPLDHATLGDKMADYEGKVVRRFRHPDIPGETVCEKCGRTMHVHGWIDSGGDGQTVCPGDYVIMDNTATFTVCPKHVFEEIYVRVK